MFYHDFAWDFAEVRDLRKQFTSWNSEFFEDMNAFYQLDSRNYGKSIHKMASGVTGQSLLSCFSFVFGRASQCCLDEWIYGNSSCNKNALFNKEHPTQRKNMVYFYFTWNRVSSDISGVIRVNGDGNHSWLQLHKSYPIQTKTSEWYKASQQQQTT